MTRARSTDQGIIQGTMFTGLVEGLGTVTAVDGRHSARRLSIAATAVIADAKLGDSLCVSGCCLTVVAIDGIHLSFEAGAETLQRSTLGALVPGDVVNLERSVRVGDRLGGHFVTGHIDCVGTVARRDDDGEWTTLQVECGPAWTRLMASKGSIAIDGVSLTLVEVSREAFSVALIPHTLQHTTLGRKATGDAVNLETDILAKYVQQHLTRESIDA